MTVVVRITGEGKVKAILHRDQTLHRVDRGWVHPNLAIPIHGHETKCRIDHLVDNREVEPVSLRNRPPVVDSGAAQGINTDAELRAANGVHVNHVREISDISIEVVVPVRRRSLKSLVDRNSFHALQLGLEKFICFLFNPIRDGRPPPVRRLAGCT